MRVIDLSVPGAERAATAPDSEAAFDGPVVVTADPGDPYEESNRGRFESHVWLHRTIITPVEQTYTDVVPDPVRGGVHNVLSNLESPKIFTNDVLQFRLPRATGTAARFVVNSTLGIAGIFDVAAWFGIPYHDDDFGQTLATYGVDDSPYLLVPLIGPSNPRDLGGKVVDFVLNPLHYIPVPGGLFTSAGRMGLNELDSRSEHVGELEDIADTAPDPYAAERNLARDRRNIEIYGTMAAHDGVTGQ